MKRVRHFLIGRLSNGAEGSLPEKVPPGSTTTSISSWHQCWESAIQMLDGTVLDGTAPPKCEVDLAECKQRPEFEIAICDARDQLRVIAVFSQRNFETASAAQEGNAAWSSFSLGSSGVFANLNRRHYGWNWLPGAQREVPFRLNFLERHLEAKPDGLAARCFSFVAEARDLLPRS